MTNKAIIEGEVILRDGRGSECAFYELEIDIPDTITTTDKARMYITRGGVASDLLKKEYNNFKSVRTCQVLTVTTGEAGKELTELEALTLEAVELGCVPENLDNYKRKDYKAKALQKAIDSHKARAEKAKKKKSNVVDEGFVD